MHIAEVLQQIEAAQDLEGLRGLLSRVAPEVGMDGIYVINYHPAKGMTILDNRPSEWLNYYGRQGYIHFDPIAYRAFSGGVSFTWDDCMVTASLSREQRMLMLEARDFGLNQGYNTVSPDTGFVASTCCFYNRSAGDFYESMRGHKKSMEVVGVAAQTRLASLVEQSVEIPQLTQREIECLTWAATGKTNDEIGTILTLSANTVNSYLRTAAQKLNVRTKIHAVVKAIQLKIIFPI